MENVLTERTQEWMNLERATLKQRMIADEFYEKKLMRPIVSEFLMNNKEAVREEVEGMILTVGTSYEPLVLSIQLFKPKRILFLYTPNTERFIDKVIKFCRLKNSTYDKRMVRDRKSTRLNSSHVSISYAVFCLKKKIVTKYNK